MIELIYRVARYLEGNKLTMVVNYHSTSKVIVMDINLLRLIIDDLTVLEHATLQVLYY